MKTSVIALLILSVLVLASVPAADVPELINYQGILTDSGGSPLDGTYNLTFKVYPDSGVSAVALWTEQHIGVDVDEGLFNVILGANSPITAGLFSDPERWMGITVDVDPEMYPRMRITSVPWALRAAVADSALNTSGGAGDGHSLDADDGSPVDVVYVTSEGRVGINTTTVGAFQLYVNGDVGIPYTAGYQVSSYDAVSWNSGTGSIVIGTHYPGLEFYAGDVEPRMIIDRTNGNVGINTDDPADLLDVYGPLRVSGDQNTEKELRIVRYHDSTNVHTIKSIEGGNSGLQVSTYLNGDIALMPGGTGQVGIGTTNPAEALDVTGRVKMDGFRLTTGPMNGYVLTSDINGIGTWQAPAALSDGDWTISGVDMFSAVAGNVHIGGSAPNHKLDVIGDINATQDYKIGGYTVLHKYGTSNVAVGASAGEFNTSWGCAFMGRWAGHSNQGFNNTFVGCYAGTTSTGGANTFVGFNSGNSNTSGNDNTFMGYASGEDNTTGQWNTFLGHGSGKANVDGNYNTCVGMNSGDSNTGGDDNVFIGLYAGNGNTTGNRNVAIGNRTGNNNTTGSGNVFIGNRAGYYETGSDKLYIANAQYDTDVLIYGDFAGKEVGINTVDPASELEIYKDADEFVGLYITNPNTGISASEGIYFKNEDGSVTGIRLQPSDQMSIFNNRPSGYISWSTAGSQRMVIANNGNVGIGTGSPGNLLHVDGTVQIGSAETIADIGAYVLGCTADWVSSTDGTYSLGLSTNRWSEVWAFDGTINTSDVRLKEGIRDLEYGLDEVMELRPVSFTWRDRPQAGTRLGLIAQDVEPVMSEVVADQELVVEEGEFGPTLSTRPAENLGIYYSQLVPVLIKAVQEQQGMIADQAERIAELEARIAQIEN